MSPAGSDEALIKQQVLPVDDGKGGVQWKGNGHKTLDVRQMKERCTSLGIAVDWKRVKKIVDHRNKIEHYYASLNQTALRTLVADSFILIRDILRGQLGEDPLNALGLATWTSLTTVADVYQKEKKECEDHVSSVEWDYGQVEAAINEWQCSDCGSGLIDVTNPDVDNWHAHLKCRSCGKEFDFETAVEDAVGAFFAAQNHNALKDGGDEVTILCPNCCHGTYDLEENACLICGEFVERECQRCGSDIPASEIDGSGCCSWCNHMMSKDD